METIPTFTHDSILLCPTCGDTHTHVDDVMVSAGPEDCKPRTELSIKATSGRIMPHSSWPTPTIAGDGGRRHRIALIGRCENGGHKFAVVFAQHKGSTFVGAVDLPK